MDEYAEEFTLLMTRNEFHDSQVQLVSRFIGGLRPQLQTAMAQFDPTTIGEAHRHVASFEKQSRSSSWTTTSSRARSQDQMGKNIVSSSTKETTDAAPTATKSAT